MKFSKKVAGYSIKQPALNHNFKQKNLSSNQGGQRVQRLALMQFITALIKSAQVVHGLRPDLLTLPQTQ